MSVANYVNGLADGSIKLKAEAERKLSATEKYAQSEKVKAKGKKALRSEMPPVKRKENTWQNETETQ